MSEVQALQQSAAEGKLIIITGAGTSLALADPANPAKNWKQLIGSGLQTAKVKAKISETQFSRWTEALQSNDMDELLATAEFVSAKLGGPEGILYERWMEDTFKNMKVKAGSERDAFQKIAQRAIPISTLNYDTLLEQATGLHGINYTDSMRTMSWARREEKGIFHLHGIWNQPATCILSIRDYEKAVQDEFRVALQRGLTSFNRLLFIGCGDTFSDPNFAALLAWMRKVLRGASLKHYALVRDDEVSEKNADELWHGFIDPIGYGPAYDDLPAFLDRVFGTTTRRRTRNSDTRARGEPIVLKNYREFILRDCGQMTIEGVRADMETAQQKFDLERLFVPLTVEAVPPEISDTDPERAEKIDQWRKKHSEPVPFGVAFGKRKSLALLALPGGGKTILLKRLAVAYADKNRMSLSDDQLPDLDLLPVLIRCREWRDHIRKPLASILESLPEITGQPRLRGLTSALQPVLKVGKVLLLIDGLDEIHDDADRTIFVENAERFLTDYPKIRLVVSSREAGFALVAPCLMRFCERWRIAPLGEEAISTLISYWHDLMGGASQATNEEARSLTQTLLHNPALRRLAENPLLLTMLLVVKHGGRLPPDRVSLYERAVDVLLDTWNIKGHQPLNSREAVPQLAYAAFELMKTGRQTATERELLRIIEECRQNVPMIRRYTKDAPHEFLKRVELRSSLVVEAGHVAEGGKTVPFYQFRHLTFQEYLAAVAAVEGHHPGYTQGETLLGPLGDVVLADEWKEVIPMAAVLGRKQAEPLLAELVSRSEAVRQEFLTTGNFPKKNEWGRKLPAPVSRLVQCLIEEAEFSQATLAQTLPLVSFFARGCRSSENWQALSRGPYGAELIHQALHMYAAMDWPRETWLRNTVAVLSALSRPNYDQICAEELTELGMSIVSPDEKNASLALLTRLGQPDGISPSRMAEMLEVDKAGSEVRC